MTGTFRPVLIQAM